MNREPKVTIALIAYNQEKYIEKSLISCLQQDYSNLTIVISDDFSQDNTYKIIKETISKYDGSHKIIINKNKENLGIGRHFSFVMENLVEGELVITTGGDDISRTNRATKIVEQWIKNNKPSLIAHSLEEIDEVGKIIEDFRTFQYAHQDNTVHSNNLFSLNEYQKYQYPLHYIGAAVAYRIDTYTDFGHPETYPDCEDHFMYFRALLSYGVHYFPEVLVSYRRHTQSYTSLKIKPFNDNHESFLSYFLRNKQYIHESFINCYTSHKITVQQWLDYTVQTRKNKIKVDYQLVDIFWWKMLHRHKYLINNKNSVSKLKTTLNKLKYFNKESRYDAKKYGMEYIKPLNTVIFGTDAGAKNTLSKIGPGFNVIYACNTDPALKGKRFKSLEIIGLVELDRISESIDCILIASNKYFEIMKIILENTSLSKNKITRVPSRVISKS